MNKEIDIELKDIIKNHKNKIDVNNFLAIYTRYRSILLDKK